jgi:hypothetical protein
MQEREERRSRDGGRLLVVPCERREGRGGDDRNQAKAQARSALGAAEVAPLRCIGKQKREAVDESLLS